MVEIKSSFGHFWSAIYLILRKKSKFSLYVSIGEKKVNTAPEVFLAVGQLMETGIPLYVLKL